MNCNETNELLAAYAVEALAASDAQAVGDHLATCRKHDEELANLISVTSNLVTVAGEREPSPELRVRLLSTFDAEVAAQRISTSSHPPRREVVRVVPFVRRPTFAWLAAAALFLAVIGLTTWNVVLQTGDSDDSWTVSASVVGAGIDGHLWYSDRLQLAVISMEEMPVADSGRVYQAWGIFDGGPVSLGVMPDEDTIAMKVDLAGASAFAITEEPIGGSAQPTRDPIAIAELG